jgi:hypothetical protein
MITIPCHPSALGKTIQEIDKWRTSGMERKQAEFIAQACDNCPLDVKRACVKQGTYINLDNERIFCDGIFGGLTEASRRSMI